MLIILFFILFLLVSNILIACSLIKSDYKEGAGSSSSLSFSVVIALRNEEKNVSQLVSFLDKIDYPEHLYEIIFVDDKSTDKTPGLLKKLIQSKNNYRILCAEKKILPAKKGALTIGIENSKYPFIIITDADCITPKNWLIEYNHKFMEGFDLVFGPAPFIQEKKIINRIASFENLRSHILSFSFAGYGIPHSAYARNIGFKKESFIAVGGYSNTSETLSGDDDLLIREFVKNNMRIGVLSSGEASVLSSTPLTFGEYLKQKARHTSTSVHYLLKHKLILASWHLVNILSLFSIVFPFIYPELLILPAVKIISDLIMVKYTGTRFGYKFRIHEILFLQVIYEIFLVLNFLTSFSSLKNRWKDN